MMLLSCSLVKLPAMISLLMSWIRFTFDSCFVNLCCIIAQSGLLVKLLPQMVLITW
jgi:hypothetical protein